MAAEDMKGLFPRLRKRAAKNAMPSVEAGTDMSRAGQPGGGLTDAQAKAMSEGKPLPKRTPPKEPDIDPGIRSLKEMTDREIRGEPPINRVTKSTSDVVTVPDAFTDTKGVTYYQPKGDPFQYEYDATDKSFTAKKDGQAVVTVRPGDPAYEEFLKHAKGVATGAHGGKAPAAKPAAEEAPAEASDTSLRYGEGTIDDVVAAGPSDDPNQLPPMSPDEPEAPAAGGPDESVFAPRGGMSSLAAPSPPAGAEDPGIRTLRAQEARRLSSRVPEAAQLFELGLLNEQGEFDTAKAAVALARREITTAQLNAAKKAVRDAGIAVRDVGPNIVGELRRAGRAVRAEEAEAEAAREAAARRGTMEAALNFERSGPKF